MDIQPYPLQWPLSTPRTAAEDRRRALSGKADSSTHGWSQKKQLTIAQALRRLTGEIDRYTKSGREWRADPSAVVVSTNMAVRLDGLPYSNRRAPEDPGVCVYFELDGFPIALPCDTFDRVADNIAAIAGHIEADRKQERYGVGTSSARYAGFKALPETGTGFKWWDILEVSERASHDEIKAAYRRKAKETHPDSGGDSAQFEVVRRAYEMAIPNP